MPRNKAYESLEKLARRGMIEIQQGRPTLYRAMGAKAVINNLVEEYSKGAKEALGVLERKQEDLKEEVDSDIQNASSWMVRGEIRGQEATCGVSLQREGRTFLPLADIHRNTHSQSNRR